MYYLFTIGIISFILVLLLGILSLGISENLSLDREEISSYECGFEHVSYSRLPFSFRYFFLTLIFLVFDIEVVFLLFLPSSLLVGVSQFHTIIFSFLFIILLTIRLIYE